MALPLLAGLAIRTVAQYTMRYGVPAARKAYQAYIKKNKPKNPTKVTEMFKNKTVTNAGNKFKEAASKTKTSARKTNTPRPPKKDPKKDTTKDTSKTEKPDVKKSRSQRAFEKGANMTQAQRNALVRKRGSQALGITGVGVGVSEAVKNIQSSRAKAKAKAEAEAKRKKELKQKQKDRANQRMNQANPNVQTSARSGGFEAKRDKPVMGSSKNIRMGSGKGTTTFEDKDKNVVRDRSGKAVKSKSGKVRTRDTFKSSAFMGGGMPMKKKMMSAGGNMKKKGYAMGGLKTAPEGNKGLAKLPTGVRNKMGYMKKGGVAKKKMMAGGMPKKKGYAAGGMSKKKGYAAGGRVTMKRSTARGK